MTSKSKLNKLKKNELVAAYSKLEKELENQTQATNIANSLKEDCETINTNYLHKISKLESDILIYKGKLNNLLLSNKACADRIEQILADKEEAVLNLEEVKTKKWTIHKLFDWF